MNKLEFLVRKLQGEAEGAEALVALLLERHVEYRTRASADLLAEVGAALDKAGRAARAPDMSLNRSLTSGYQKNGLLRAADKAEDAPPQEAAGDDKGLAKKRKRRPDSDGSPAEQVMDLRFLAERPAARFADLAGLDGPLSEIREMLFHPVTYASLYAHLCVQAPSGLLLLGPSGVGKTALAHAVAGESGLPFFKVTGPELIGGTSGESEQNIRALFAAATKSAPSIVFIDNIDAIAGIREASQRGMDRRIVAQLFDCMDAVVALQTAPTHGAEPANASTLVIVIAATNRADSLDPGLRGRFAREVSLPVPDAEARCRILAVLAGTTRLAAEVDLRVLGRSTPGFVGADLRALLREAGTLAVRRIVAMHHSRSGGAAEGGDRGDGALTDSSVELASILATVDESCVSVSMEDLAAAARSVQPSAKREGFAVVPDVSWADVGALAEVRDELLHNFLRPIANPMRFRRLGLEVPAGVIFYGPPGCGKTLLAKALANQSGANFISVKGPELLNMYVGESESKVRQVFARARASTPCMIFFDELDALVPKRGASDGGNGVSERVVNQFLTELDGLEARRDVYVVAATNRLELIDEAMLRPGRLGKLLYVPLPVKEERVSILKALTRKVALDRSEGTGVDVEAIGSDDRIEGFSGADIAALVREAGMAVVKDWSDDDANDAEEQHSSFICSRHFEAAFLKVRPSVSAQDRLRYEKVHSFVRQGMGAIEALRAAASEVRR